MEAEVTLVEEVMRDAGATDVTVARTAEERNAQWEARHHAYWALVNMYPGHVYLITDMAAEHGAAVDWMRRLKALFDPQGLLNPGKII